MLRDIKFKSVYKSEYDNILEDFYIPALENSVAYDRAVGFFSARMISYAAQGLSAFITQGGKMRLVVGAELDEEDHSAILQGYRQREILDRVGEEFVQEIERVDDDLFLNRVRALAWLVAHNRLDVKVALRRKGMYHEKIGILRDSDGDQIVFQGSANESIHALLPDFNYESIHVYQCWRPELEGHFTPHLESFDRLWGNSAKNTAVLGFPDAARHKLISITHAALRQPRKEIEIELFRKSQGTDDESAEQLSAPSIPSIFNGEEFQIRERQRTALQKWRSDGNGVGVLALATGAGKTITACYGAVKLFETFGKLFLVVSVPYQNLADQWADVLAEFNIRPIRCYVARQNWVEKLNQAVYLFRSNAQKFAAAIVVNRTLQDDQFQRQLERIPGDRFLWIGDECHYHGSEGLSHCLPRNAALRMGLSATPEHYIDQDANARLAEFYGKIVDSYSISDALNDDVLTPYRYHVIPVELNEREADEYHQITLEVSRIIARNTQDDAAAEGANTERLQALLMRRARLLSAAENKLHALREILSEMQPRRHSLFYCGDGTVGDADVGQATRQIEAVSAILHQCGWKTSRFTSREDRKQRIGILQNFRLGLIDAMVAIRCLDEGIDVPACRLAFLLASARNPRQFVQRRGRILRKSPGKSESVIYDFLVRIPPALSNGFDYERNLLVSEMKRVAEFSSLALNRAECYERLNPLLKEYDLEHHLV